jgi:hypothetical protein
MSISLPVKQILKFRVPGVLALALIAGQFLITELPKGKEQLCKISVERPHTSTYMKKRENLEILKLNITTECEVPQEYTIVDADIQAIIDNVQISVQRFNSQLRVSDGKGRYKARFRDLQVDCDSIEPTMYLGQAWAEVHLKNGDVEKVSGDSQYFVSQDCRIDAK